ncbi:Protein BPS1, chloroplastic [Dillenia turbinata]|uniref:Protein BPS1, chloroplastic n=1 Tax=Dillenia turbinata TaxID=194707 RepID=A0AAN8UV17_9MAGN
MAKSSFLNASNCPLRSISLPSRLHSNSHKIEAELNKAKACKKSFLLAPLQAKTVKDGLVRLAELYNCVEDFINSPSNQQALHQQREKLVDEALDASVAFLDTCDAARDFLSTLKEYIEDIQLALRRGQYSRIESKVSAYLCFTKKMKKDFSKCLRPLKYMERKMQSSPALLDFDDHDMLMVVKVLGEVKMITISVFRCLVLSLTVPEKKVKLGGWSLIAKLIHTASFPLENDQRNNANEVESAHDALCSLLEQFQGINAGEVDAQVAKTKLEALEMSIEGLQVGLDSMRRCLLQNRVSLLNILTN